MIEEGWQCVQDTNLLSTCSLIPICGNKIKETNEECDDGNLEIKDGCNKNCEIEEIGSICGDGVKY